MEPFSILAAIGTSVQILGIAIDCISGTKEKHIEYKDFGKRLQHFQHRARSCKAQVSSWSRLWAIDNSLATDPPIGIKLWSEDGWQVIEKELSNVDDLCGDFMLLIRHFNDDEAVEKHLKELKLKREKMAEGSSNKLHKMPPLFVRTKSDSLQALSEERRGAVLRRHDEAKAIASATKMWEKINILFLQADKLEKTCTGLEKSIASLRKNSKLFFFSRYTHLSPEASIDERQMAVEDRYKPLGHAAAFRPLIAVLHRIISESKTDVRLELDTIEVEDPEQPRLAYRVIYDAASPDSQRITLRLMGNSDAERTLTLVDAAEGLDYALETIPKSLQLKNGSLAEVLRKVTRSSRLEDRWGLFPISEREILSFHLAESALFLIGTSWLSALSSANLNRTQSVKDAQYLLRILESDKSRCELLQRLEKASGEDGVKLDSQCWSLGVLLVEIKLGKKVEDIIGRKPRVFLRLTDGSEIDIDGPELESVCGPTYHTAITYCFRPTANLYFQGVDERQYCKWLIRFYELVYLPLKAEYSRRRLRQERISQKREKIKSYGTAK